jgi:putative nucleotidyltransferase with HDIG domain
MNTCLLYSISTQKLTMREKILNSIQKEADIPGFSAPTRKLMSMVGDPNTHLDSVVSIVKLDPGIAAKFLKVASSPSFGGREITDIKEALSLIGMNEVRKIAMTILVVNRLKNMRVTVDWDLFWLHSLLTARLTELIAQHYRPQHPEAYLAGLLHDVGKLFMQHYFPQEFELVILRAVMVTGGMFQAEQQLLDINHAEVSSLLCEKWELHPEIVRAILFHHNPTASTNVDPKDPEFQHFLATCIYLADTAANYCHANIQGGHRLDKITLNDLPEWKSLEKFNPIPLALDVPLELKKAQDIIISVKQTSKS